MTEIETLKQAKMYMEKLANGINPIDESVIPDEDVVNNVRVSRCFFYVADVLQQVIDHGGITPRKESKKEPKKEPKKESKKEPFSLSVAQRNMFAYATSPIPITEVTKRINALSAKENMATLRYNVIQEWLMSLGMLEETLDGNGKKVKRPSAKGQDIGIVLDARMGINGPFFVVVYTLAAQHFIIDHLDGIIAFEHAKTENQGQPWSVEHDQCLKDLYLKGVEIKEIAITLKRNKGEVRARLKKLGEKS